MPSRAERSARSLTGALRRLLLALLVLCAAGLAQAQDRPAIDHQLWEEAIVRAQAAIAAPGTETFELERVRDTLQRLRSAALAEELAAASRVADANARLTALGPPPAEGVEEAPDIAARRAAITEDLAAAQAPLIDAQDFQRRAATAIRDIDRIVRQRFADQLLSRGPSPIWPANWYDAISAVVENVRAADRALWNSVKDPQMRGELLRRVPVDIAGALIGIAIAFTLRRNLVSWVEERLATETDRRPIALLVTLRNVSRLLVPAVGAGLLFAAFDPDHVLDPSGPTALFVLPAFVLAIIASGWLASSLFAPKLPAYRLAPVDDATAQVGARLTVSLGVLVALQLFIERYVEHWEMTPGAAAVLVFPLFLAGGVLLWRTSRLLRTMRRAIAERGRAASLVAERTSTLGLSSLGLLERGIWLIALASPLLAGIGYMAAADYLLYSAILTLGLIGGAVVLFDLLTTMVGAVSAGPGASAHGPSEDGLAPVAIAAALAVAGLPALALIWGARPSELADVWYMLRDGVTLGGIRISLSTISTFVIVFAILFGLTRVLRTLLRNTVLPRTSLDAGGRNAILAGVSYIGFTIAVFAAVSATGVDLTSLAVVAGALSVGIGFGLQNIVSNFVSGIILLVERPIKEGDWIEVGGNMGYVRDISVRSTVIETFDRASLILPNSDLVAGTVLNRTHTGMSGRIQVPVTVAIESDARKVERLLLDIAENHPLVLAEPQPAVLLMEIGPDALLFEIRVWLRDVNFSLSARSDLNFEVLARLDAEGVRRQPYLRDARKASDPQGEATLRANRLDDAQDPDADADAQTS